MDEREQEMYERIFTLPQYRAILNYLDDRRKPHSIRKGIPCPAEYQSFVIADRFGSTPWEVEALDVGLRERIFRTFLVEEQILTVIEGLGPKEPLVYEGIETDE